MRKNKINVMWKGKGKSHTYTHIHMHVQIEREKNYHNRIDFRSLAFLSFSPYILWIGYVCFLASFLGSLFHISH